MSKPQEHSLPRDLKGFLTTQPREVILKGKDIGFLRQWNVRGM